MVKWWVCLLGVVGIYVTWCALLLVLFVVGVVWWFWLWFDCVWFGVIGGVVGWLNAYVWFSCLLVVLFCGLDFVMLPLVGLFIIVLFASLVRFGYRLLVTCVFFDCVCYSYDGLYYDCGLLVFWFWVLVVLLYFVGSYCSIL